MSLTEYREQIWIRQENVSFRQGLPKDERDARNDGTFFSSLESVCDLVRVGVQISQHPTEQGGSNLEGETAHLVSNAPVCHVAYTKTVQAATGYFVDSYEKRRKLLNGMKGPSRRWNDSGIKHSKYNKFHLATYMPKQLLDSTPPALIIVPILPLSKVKDWNLMSFDAMVLPCGPRGLYAAEMVMRNVRECCDENEIRNGIEVLRYFIKDIAESLIDEDPDVLKDVDIAAGSSNHPSLLLWRGLVTELRGDRASIQVPVLKNGLEWERLKVAKGTFDFNDSCLPDPFLLAVKGAVNFSSLVGTKLIPACPSEDSDSVSA